MLPASETLEFELQQGWLTIWFNQLENRNALSDAMVADLKTVLRSVRDDRSVRGITLRGRGGMFCSGGDLKSFQKSFQNSASRDDIVSMSKSAAELFDLTNTMPQVVVALIEGAAMAGGFGLACCADVVICDRAAKFAFTETKIGLSPAQIAPFVIQRLGMARARRLMLTAARFDGAAAEEIGFADFVTETPEDLEQAELAIRKQVLSCAPGAVADTKSLILRLPELNREQAVLAAAENFADRILSDEGREGVASFVEKRSPNWARKSD